MVAILLVYTNLVLTETRFLVMGKLVITDALGVMA